ncbi:hypothetical protein [uncultured Amnibacterium sp.]|uniref:hypothetical protein n=1 Tax=uncultured Amnibacterium sp. TaxID=1631851 RepID=UPI0035CBD7F9
MHRSLTRPVRVVGVATALVLTLAAARIEFSGGFSGGQTGATLAVDHPCATPSAGHASCLLQVVPAATSSATIAGLTPAAIASAYGLNGGGSGTIAVVDAYDNPNLESDLAVYRSTWGLPACTTANGCFRKVGQTGSATDLPRADASWGEETSLDVDAASAACPACRLLVVEARNDSMSSLGTAVNTAVSLGATAVSNSYGGPENGAASAYSSAYFTHAGVPVVASTGDDGYQPVATIPAALPNVIAVGGTTLTRTSAAPAVRSAAAARVVLGSTAVSTRVDRDIAAVNALKKALKKATATLQHRRASHCTSKACRRALSSATTTVHRLTKSLATARKTLAADRRKARTPTPAPVPVQPPTPVSAPTTGPAPTVPPTTSARGWAETVWSGAGSGCSAQVARPAWQSGAVCTGRSIADVAAVADPATGLAVYDTYGTSQVTRTGWLVAGGTSLAAPLITGMLVRSGAAATYSDASPFYAHAGRFTDVTAGSNGTCGTALCNGTVGYDGPTGVGTPSSLASF